MSPTRLLFAALGLGYLFLYGPIAGVIAFSFNEARLPGVWTGFSLRWYSALLDNGPLLRAAGLSVVIAAVAATLATLVGTAAAFAFERAGAFRGRLVLAVLVLAPLVLPEVVTGLAFLLFFVALEGWIGWPAGRGATTISIAHATFGLAFVALVVRARLARLDHALEEAAADLGARPATVFVTVTLPAILPAVAAGWLLAFTLSFDDLVIASFTAGPGSTTLPMQVFSAVRLGVSPEINALASLIVAVVALALLGALRLMTVRGRAGGEVGGDAREHR